MSEDEEMEARKEYLARVRSDIIERYSNALNVSEAEEVTVLAFHKLDLAYLEASTLHADFSAGDIPLEVAMIGLDVLLGGLTAVKKQLSEHLK
jgi:energy-converting hydrogenase A subunit M